MEGIPVRPEHVAVILLNVFKKLCTFRHHELEQRCWHGDKTKGWTTVEYGRYKRYFSSPKDSYQMAHSAASSMGTGGTFYRDRATTA